MLEYQMITVLCRRFDYSGAYNIARALNIHQTPLGSLLQLCKSSVNFDFHAGRSMLPDLKDVFSKEDSRKLQRNHEALIAGEPDAMFSEHLWSMRFQLEQEEFIDFLGRLYRFNEAFLKYVFVLKHTGKKSIFDEIYEEGRILRILRKKYNIHNRNIIFAIHTFLLQTSPMMPGVKQALEFLTGKEMKALADLRNSSIVGHGFQAVSEEMITQQFAPPRVLLDQLRLHLEHVGLSIDTQKYHLMNDVITKSLEREFS